MSFPLFLSIQGLALVTAGFVVAIILVVAQRLWLHAYSSVPGPTLAKVTSLYAAFHSWRGTMHLDIQRCHREYGDLIRYAPNQILSLHAPDMAGIYGPGAPFRKSRGYKTMIPIPDGWSTMTSIDKNLHLKLRRVFRSGVDSDSLARFEPAILRNLKVYFSQLTKDQDKHGWSFAADMRRWNLCLGFDTMSDFGLGIQTNLLASSARDFVFSTLYFHEKKMGLWEQLPTLCNMGTGYVVAAVYLLASSKARMFTRWYKKVLDEAVTNNATESRGIFGPVIQSGLGLLAKPGHNRAQMIGEGAFSTFSSADAYGIMISGLLHFLSRHPQAYEKLSAELRNTYRPGEDIIWDNKLESHVYLRAVINEVMRLLPPACGVHWRECEQPGFSVGPDKVPLTAGSDVGMSIFSLFRDERIFRDPVRFWPERWVPGTLPEEEYSMAKKMFTPFLIGPRRCAGSHVALMIGSIAYAYILVNYDFRLDSAQQTSLPDGTINTPAEADFHFESHYSIAGWESGPFIQFRTR